MRSTITLILLLLSLPLAGQPALGLDTSFRGPFAVDGERAYFATETAFCVTDGTEEGTAVLYEEAVLYTPAVVWKRVGWTVGKTPGGEVLIGSDGTRLSLPGAGNTMYLAPAGDALLLFTWQRGTDLVRTDGTAAGTSVIATIPGYTWPVAVAGGIVYLEVQSGNGRTLWRTDGTAAGTYQFLPRSTPLFVLGDRIAFFEAPHVMVSDGTPEGTSRLTTGWIRSVEGETLLVSRNRELWRVDTAGRETKLADIPFHGHLGAAVLLNDGVLALEDGDREWAHVWWLGPQISIPAKAANLGVDSSGNELHVWRLGRAVVFTADSYGYRSATWWRTDGTGQGTSVLHEPIDVPWVSRKIEPTAKLGERLLFTSRHPVCGEELWITDGTRAGTHVVANLTREAVVRGRVTDAATGRAVEGAAVSAFQKGARVTSVRTDADGRYVMEGLRPEDTTLEARSGEHAPQLWSATPLPLRRGETAGDIDFALSRGAVLRGRVVDASGAPVAGMPVVVAEGFGLPPVATAVTDADGRYVTTPVATGKSWTVFTGEKEGWSTAFHGGRACPGGCPHGATGMLVKAPADAVDIVARPWGRIRGRILDKVTGQLITADVLLHVEVKSLALPRGSSTNGVSLRAVKGEFSVSVPDGTYDVYVSAGTTYRAVFYPDVPCEPCSYLVRGPAVTPRPGETLELELGLQPLGARIRGRVTDAETGLPLAGVEIRDNYVSPDFIGNGTSQVAVTDANGEYETRPYFTNAYWTYYVSAGSDEYVREVWDGAEGAPCDPCRLPTGKPLVFHGTDTTRADFALRRKAGLVVTARDFVTKETIRASFHLAGPAGFWWSGWTPDPLPVAPGTYFLRVERWGWHPEHYGTNAPCEASCHEPGGLPIEVGYGGTVNLEFQLRPQCGGILSPAEETFPATGGTGTIRFSQQCHWCPPATDFTSSTCRTAGPVFERQYRVEPNPAPHPRSVVLQLPGGSLTVKQEGASVPARRRTSTP